MCVFFSRLFVNGFVCCFLLTETQRGSGSQESAWERRPGPCAVVTVRCVSVYGSNSDLCAVPPYDPFFSPR